MDESYVGERSIASLLHKEPITEGVCIYTFVNTIIGYFDPKTQIFVDDQGREYENIESDLSIFSTSQFACGNIMDLDKAYDQYMQGEKTTDIQDLFNSFDEEESNYYYLSAIDENGYLLVLKHDYNKELDDYYEKIFGKDGLLNPNLTIEEIQERAKNIKDNMNISIDLNMAEVEKNLKENKYNKKELMQLKNKLSAKDYNIKQLIEMADKQLNIKKPKKQPKKNKYYYDDGVLNIKSLLKDIKKTLIAQDEPSKRLLVEICRMDLDDSKKSGILVTGSTGVGKTELMTLISEKLERPFLIVDTMQLTSPGYEGKNIEQCLYELYEKCNGDIKKAEKAIIYFDEIDKKGSSKKDDVGGQGVLNLLLKFLDGSTYMAAPNLQSGGLMQAVKIKTDDMLIIAGGAFSDLYGKKEKAQIGFNKNKEENKKQPEPTITDFVEKAMMSNEFMGRFPIHIRLNDLKPEDMKRILLESDKSPTKIEERIFKKMNCKLRFTDDAYEAFAARAEKLKEGARGLKGIVKNSTAKAFEDVNDKRDKYETITITADTVNDNTNYSYVIRKNTSIKKGAN